MVKSITLLISVGVQVLTIGVQVLTIGAQVLTIRVQVLTIGMQVLTVWMQNAPAYINELCVNLAAFPEFGSGQMWTKLRLMLLVDVQLSVKINYLVKTFAIGLLIP